MNLLIRNIHFSRLEIAIFLYLMDMLIGDIAGAKILWKLCLIDCVSLFPWELKEISSSPEKTSFRNNF